MSLNKSEMSWPSSGPKMLGEIYNVHLRFLKLSLPSSNTGGGDSYILSVALRFQPEVAGCKHSVLVFFFEVSHSLFNFYMYFQLYAVKYSSLFKNIHALNHWLIKMLPPY